MTTAIEQGKFLWFDPIRKFGFVRRDAGGKDLFFHASGLIDADLQPDERCEFLIVPDRGDRLKASGIRRVRPATPEAPPTTEWDAEADLRLAHKAQGDLRRRGE